MNSKHLTIARRLAKLLDGEFKIFGKSFGLDPILGFMPVVGDLIPVLVSLYIVWIGYTMGLGKGRLFQMVFYVIADYAIGLIPVVGDIADFGFKSNFLNLKIISDATDSKTPKSS